MSVWDDVGVAILNGGQSSRMGQDKAALQIDGISLLTATARLALQTGAPVLIVGRQAPVSFWAEHGDGESLRREPTFVPDDEPGQGPLGGLLSALRWNALSIDRRPRVMLLPCDMPLLELSALEWLANEASTCGARDGLAATRGGELEPLFSVYFAEVEAAARERLASGRRSLRGLIERGDFAKVECPPDVARQIFNCNTPEDWRVARGV